MVQAEELASLLKSHDLASHVNLIPWNPVDESEFERPSGNAVRLFHGRRHCIVQTRLCWPCPAAIHRLAQGHPGRFYLAHWRTENGREGTVDASAVIMHSGTSLPTVLLLRIEAASHAV